MILVDTSAWVEYDRATKSPIHLRLAGLIASGGDLGVTEPVLMEVLAGARDEQSAVQLRRLLTSFGWVPAEAGVDFEGGARIYRECRAAGFTTSLAPTTRTTSVWENMGFDSSRSWSTS